MSTSKQSVVGPSFDEADWDEAVADIERADALIEKGEIEEGLALASAAAERLVSVVGRDHPDHAQALVSVGDALVAMGRMAEGVEHFETALAILDLFTEEEDAAIVRPRRLTLLARVGYQRALAGAYHAAESCLREALEVARMEHGDESPELAEHYNTLGVCLRFAGRYEEAREAYHRAGALREAAARAQPPAHYHNLSGLATAQGDHEAAEGYARAAITARMEDSGRGFELGTDLCGLADALVGLGRYAEAEAAYREALELYAASSRPRHPEVAFALHNLADALAEQGRGAEAEAAYRESIARKIEALGETSHELAASLNNLAVLLAGLGRNDEARETITRAVAIADAVLMPEHPIAMACRATASSFE